MRGSLRAFLLFLATAAMAQPAASLTSVDYVLDPFRRGRFEELEAALDRLAGDDTRMDDGTRAVDFALSRLADMLLADETLVPRLETWRKGRRPWGEQAKARLEERLAWQARGGGFASSVPKDAWPVFHEHLEAAEAALGRALALAPEAKEPLGARVRLSLHRDRPREELATRFKEALAADPVSPAAHDAMFLAVGPHWGGSEDALLAFARESGRLHPDDPYLRLLVVRAHRERIGRDDRKRLTYYRAPEVWAEVSAAAEVFVKALPDSEYGHNLLAQLAVLAGQRETARRELRWIGERRDPRVWDASEFARVREWAAHQGPVARPTRSPPASLR